MWGKSQITWKDTGRAFDRMPLIQIVAHILNKLKVVSATFLLVCFSSLKESTCETRKNVFCFTSKALFVLEKIKF